MPENWQQRIETIASNLLTLEVNTAIKEEGISAQKMPELPIAMHSLVAIYAEYLLDSGSPVTQTLLSLAANRIIAKEGAAVVREALENWDPRTDTSERVRDLTNGPETFEALLWAADASHSGRRRDGADAPDPALIARIGANCRQLREAAIVLEQEFSSNRPDLQGGMQTYEARLQAVVDGAAPDPESSRLFGGTIDQTAKALFRHPRPVVSIAPDLTVLIRKAWDIGLEEIRFQTMLQLDGDVLVRVARESDAAQPTYLSDIHRQAVNDGIAQWHLMFKVVGDLIEGIGRYIFGRSAS